MILTRSWILKNVIVIIITVFSYHIILSQCHNSLAAAVGYSYSVIVTLCFLWSNDRRLLPTGSSRSKAHDQLLVLSFTTDNRPTSHFHVLLLLTGHLPMSMILIYF